MEIIKNTAASVRDWCGSAPERPLVLSLGKALYYRPNNGFFLLLGLLFALLAGTAVHLVNINSGLEAVIASTVPEVRKVYRHGDMEITLGTDREEFVVVKHMIVHHYMMRHRAARVDELPLGALKGMNREISRAFIGIFIEGKGLPVHVERFFTDTASINKLETALMEQARYHVPASVKLAQAALETGWGRKVEGNNWFGIKDKNRSGGTTVTTEYFTEAELASFHGEVIEKQKVFARGKVLYKCRVRDHFTRYSTPWESFRAHSEFLRGNPRYATLFTGGKDYRQWTKLITPTGYATAADYGSKLKRIIEQYQLNLLDL